MTHKEPALFLVVFFDFSKMHIGIEETRKRGLLGVGGIVVLLIECRGWIWGASY